MTRWFRWSYVGPRLVVVLALLVLSEIGAARLMRYAVRRGGEATTGARVDVGDAEASILGTHVTFTNVAVADPRDPMKNLLEADEIGLDFDANAALRKRLVVKRGVARGLRFGAPREESGALRNRDDSHPAAGPRLGQLPGAEAAQQWLDGVQQRLAADLQSELKSVRLARELRQKWPAEYERMAKEVSQLRQESEALRAEIAEARENPLRNLRALTAAAERLAELQERFASLSKRLAEMPAEIEADRQAALAAREHDERMLRKKLSVDGIDPEALGAYLVGESIAAPVSELVGWARWARSLSATGAGLANDRARGQDVLFAGCRRTPSVLIESLRLEGTLPVAGVPLDFTGRLTGVTTEPAVHGEPARLTIATSGAAPMHVEATFDRTGTTPRDEIVAHCPALPLRAFQLGDSERLAVHVTPGAAELLMRLNLSGERLAGDIRLKQPDVRATPRVGLDLGDLVAAENLERALAERLAELGDVETRVTLSGGLDEPAWAFESSAGPALAQAVRGAVRGVAADRAERALASGRATVERQFAVLDHEVAHWTSEIAPALEGHTGALRALARELKRIPVGVIGGRTGPAAPLLK